MKRYRDIEGDGGSDIVAQVVAHQEAIQASLATVRHVLAIGSGKGGVGKSTVTMALAQALLRGGRKVAVLDADFNGPCQAQMAGLTGVPWVPGDHGLGIPRRRDGLGVLSFGSLLAAAEPLAFDSVSHGDAYVWRATREFTTLGQLLSSVDWGPLDALLVDLPPGAERAGHYGEFFGARASFVVVTIPTDLARGVVARSITSLEQAGARVLGYVDNMAGYYHRDADQVLPLFPPPHAPLAATCLGELPFDPEIARLCDRGWPDDGRPLPALPGLEALSQNVLEALETAS